MKNDRYIDTQTCNRCGLCITICPNNIIHTTSHSPKEEAVEFRADRVAFCVRCGHCMAICPTEAIHIEGLSYKKDFFDVPTDAVDYDAFVSMLASRRSIRVFKDTPVPRKALEKIVAAITMAPMGYPPHKVEVTIVQKRKTIEQALPFMVDLYEKLGKWMKNPFIRFMIRRRAGRETFNTLRTHVLPSLAYRLPAMKAGTDDTITRGAPAMLLLHAQREAGNHTEDAMIDLTYGLLAAHALGLGATAIGLIPPVVERSPELRKLFKIPLENEVLAAMIVGYPKLRFRKGIRRELAGVTWL
jgi:ferredoxin